MTRALILGIAIFVLIWLVRRSFAARRPGAPGADAEGESAAKERAAIESELVACAHCGVLLPRSEALEAEGRPYCSREHLRLGAR